MPLTIEQQKHLEATWQDIQIRSNDDAALKQNELLMVPDLGAFLQVPRTVAGVRRRRWTSRHVSLRVGFTVISTSWPRAARKSMGQRLWNHGWLLRLLNQNGTGRAVLRLLKAVVVLRVWNMLQPTFRGFSILVLQGSLILALCAQTPSKQSPESAAPQLKARAPGDPDANTQSVILNVIARDQAGNPLKGLGAQDFVLYDDKRPTGSALTLSSSPGNESNTQLLFVIDAMNSSLPDLDKSEQAVEAFLESRKSRLKSPTSILIVSDVAPQSASGKLDTPNVTNTTVQRGKLFVRRIPPSTDAAALIQGLKNNRTELHRILAAQGSVGEGERFTLSLQALNSIGGALSSEPGTKLVLWIGPGWPMLRRSDARSSDQLYDSVVFFSNLLRKARIILYSIDPTGVTPQDSSGETEAFLLASRPGAIRANGQAPDAPSNIGDSYYQQFLKGVRDPRESNANDLALQVLAYQSGGLVLQHNNDLMAQINKCASDEDSLYSLSYSPAPGTGLDVYHDLKATLSKSSEPLRTRTGIYWK